VTLSDGDVAALAREVVDRQRPGADIRITPADPVDPYRFGPSAWLVSAGGHSSYLTAELSDEQARAKLAADLLEN
jgi:hypothetical protein